MAVKPPEKVKSRAAVKHPSGEFSLHSFCPATKSRPAFHYRGNPALLELPATAFLCSTRCPGDKVLEIYTWARRQCDEGGTVISGFHTPVEKDVLAILARRGANILWAPARDLPKTTPPVLRSAESEGRLLVVTPFKLGKPSRPTKDSCSIRNRFVLIFSSDQYLPHVAEESSLANDINEASNLLVHAQLTRANLI